MERILLYYPTIEFPQKAWIRQAILYSDKVSSIIPFGNDSELPDSLKDLLDNGEYKPIFIEKQINDSYDDFRQFSKEFLHDINNNQRILYTNSGSLRPMKVDSLFKNKLSH